jgi:hypothetical protein
MNGASEKSDDTKIDYFLCDCECSLISVDVDYEYNEVGMSFWQLGHYKGKFDWHYCLRMIWCIIKRGHSYTNSILFNSETWMRFKLFINSIDTKVQKL